MKHMKKNSQTQNLTKLQIQKSKNILPKRVVDFILQKKHYRLITNLYTRIGPKKIDKNYVEIFS